MSPIAAKPLVRYFKIGWTVFFGILCLLLIGLWVSSCFVRTAIWTWLPSNGYYIGTSSEGGGIWIVYSATPMERNSPVGACCVPATPMTMNWGFHSVHYKTQDGFFYVIPHWSAVLLFGTLAAPAIPTIIRTKWRFSLRTLLIFTTLVALLLGVIVWAVRK